ncbi:MULTISPECIES: hypothetical protein [Priestia]|uniref:Uncharacterized protein n=1 Tax=Priestia megaterium TaxID=1404 RepID=A0AAE5PC13_PRIMG|nr:MULTISPECIES: hypothetical protein [Priestia]RFB29478.1 hypothetical protein DZB87_03100 [Bacillus sp. ALD]RFB41121.1 hypothetical protein DZB86_09870 [Bacillus sp. RC]MBM6599376.1 hypothetical protein [Priestia megaterium]MCA4153769.1 dynactin subunit 2 [Priestia megaterium]MCR8863600.1 dynactin subunit 2 [Priestia megaterium]
MSMKGFFNPKQTNQQLHTELEDFKHQIKRINTLEVHMNRFLKLEPQIGSLIMLKKKLEAQPSHSNDSSPSQRSTHKNAEQAYAKDKKEIANQLQFLKEKVAQLEQVISTQPPRDKKIETVPYPDLTSLIEQSVEKKMAPYLERMTELDERVSALERSMSLLTEVQVDMLKRTSALQEEVKAIHQRAALLENAPPPIHIDKFFLDKYEQNNNIGQVGIKELGGTLNIGATYGSGAIPKDFTDQIQKDMEELKNAKSDISSGKTKPAQPAQPAQEEKENSSSAFEKEETYTEVPIFDEDDPKEESI